MTFLTALGVFNYGPVLVYGLFLSAHIAGGWTTHGQKRLIWILCPLFLLIQIPCWLILGESATKQLYPLIVHLPLVLILIFALKKPAGIAIVSVCTAYLCCQLPRWVNLSVTAVTRSPLAGELSYTLVIFPIFLLLYRYFVRPAYNAMTVSRPSLVLFGSLPVAYYIFDYATVIYSDALSMGIQAINESLPTALIIFYVMFLSAYHKQMQTRADADVDAITPKRFCENELVNLLCSSFLQKANAAGIRLTINAKLPKALSLPDTELCSLLSNGLENALHAVGVLEEANQWVELYCRYRTNEQSCLLHIKFTSISSIFLTHYTNTTYIFLLYRTFIIYYCLACRTI